MALLRFAAQKKFILRRFSMKKILIAALAAGTMAFAGGSIAPIIEAEPCPEFTPQVYVGGAINWGEFSYNVYDVEVFNDDNFGIQGQIGYDVFGQGNWVLGVEARAGYIDVDTFDASYIAAYVKPQYNFDKFGVYGLVGYGQTTYSASADLNDNWSIKVEDTTDDFTWGAGIKYMFTDTIDIDLSYVVLPDYEIGVDDVDSDIIALGVNYKI
jgi:opacity protein-like surface antigen